jgi:hypothetical protein
MQRRLPVFMDSAAKTLELFEPKHTWRQTTKHQITILMNNDVLPVK